MSKAGDFVSPYQGEDIERRRFLKTSLRCAGAIAVVGGGAAFLANRDPSSGVEVASEVLDFSVPDDEQYPQLVRLHDDDPARAVDRALDALGGMDRFVSPGERVVLKPNIGWERFPDQAANTNPTLVGRVVERCLEAGADEVVVIDGSCNDPNRSYEKSGIGEAAYSAGARVLLPAEHLFTEHQIGGQILHRWPVLEPIVNADRVINLPIAKHHSLSGVTAAIKNWYGILGGTRSLLHQDIHQSLADLAHFVRPTLTLVDGYRVLVRNGPQGGSTDDVEYRGVFIAGTDQIACDALAVTLLDRSANEFPYLRMTSGVIGQMDIRRVRFRELL